MKKYKALVNRREFLNAPGFHGGAYVMAYVEDTTERDLEKGYGNNKYRNFEPRVILEIADCSDRIDLEFDFGSAAQRQNSFHKIDTLIDALIEFRSGLVEESTRYKQRQKKLDKIAELKGESADKGEHLSADEFIMKFLDGG